MKILVVGSGGREAAIVSVIDNKKHDIYCIGTNDNITIKNHINKKIVKSKNLNPKDILDTTIQNEIDLVIVGPEKPLSDGIADFLIEKNIPVVGPTKKQSRIETDRLFAKEIVEKYSCDILTPYTVFNNAESLKETMNNKKIVLKHNSLASGKGVIVQDDHFTTFEEALEFCSNGNEVVIEEKLEGKEFSVFSLSDGKNIIHFPIVRDFKRLLNKDKGPNTGGMGCISYLDHSMPFLSEDEISFVQKANEYVIKELNKYDSILHTGGYRGFLYGGFMKTKNGIKLLEYNCRLGDPEAITLLNLIDTENISFADLMYRTATGKLDEVKVYFKKKFTTCIYLTPPGYPNKPDALPLFKENEIYHHPHAKTFYADVHLKGGMYYSGYSRTMAILFTFDSINYIYEIYRSLKQLDTNLHFRTDIGQLKPKMQYNVNINEANEAVDSIKESIQSTWTSSVISNFGDYAGIFKICEHKYLISSTDGVGSKIDFVLKHLGHEEGFRSLGHDIVNHCTNDILVKGASPLFFLDYFGTSKLNKNHLKCFVHGVCEALRKINCSLISGETAELVNTYQKDKFDIIGTMIGLVSPELLISGKNNIKEGEVAIAIKSSGPHTNGYTLINELQIENRDIIENLCKPHKNYLDDIKTLRSRGVNIKGLIHITGGGFKDNPKRVLPENMYIDYFEWDFPEWCKYLQNETGLSREEMKEIYNCGIGMIVIVPPMHVSETLRILPDLAVIGVIKYIS